MHIMYDLIIIGGGPAGVAAGVYASRKKLNALLLTKDFGGQAITSAKIENFIGHIAISGLELAQVLETQLRAQKHIVITDGITVERVTKIDGGFSVVDSKGRVYDTKTILVTLKINDHFTPPSLPHKVEEVALLWASLSRVCTSP